MLKINKEDLWLIGLILFLFIGACLVFLKCYGNNFQAEQFLIKNGFNNPQIIGRDSVACENSDMYKTRFKAKKNFKDVHGIICCNYFDDCRIEELKQDTEEP